MSIGNSNNTFTFTSVDVKPLNRFFITCTGFSEDERLVLSQKIDGLGGCMSWDLTNRTTHLLVAEPTSDSIFPSEKYAFAAKYRQDLHFMCSSWIDYLHKLWINGEIIEVSETYTQYAYRPFTCLKIAVYCDEPKYKEMIHKKIVLGSGICVTDLSSKFTHFVMCTTAPASLVASLETLGIPIVVPEWIEMSLERGAALDTNCFRHTLDAKDIGNDAISNLHSESKFSSIVIPPYLADDDNGSSFQACPEFFRKQQQHRDAMMEQIYHAHSKLPPLSQVSSDPLESNISQSAGDINVQQSRSSVNRSTQNYFGDSMEQQKRYLEGTVFDISLMEAPLEVYQNVIDRIIANGGDIAQIGETYLNGEFYQLVPHWWIDTTENKLPDTRIISEFALERAIELRKPISDIITPLCHPGKGPFPRAGAANIVVSFTGIDFLDRLHFPKVIEILGAQNATVLSINTSILVAGPRADQEKIEFALFQKIPIVTAEWLYENYHGRCSLEDWTAYSVYQTRKFAKIRKISNTPSAKTSASGIEKPICPSSKSIAVLPAYYISYSRNMPKSLYENIIEQSIHKLGGKCVKYINQATNYFVGPKASDFTYKLMKKTKPDLKFLRHTELLGESVVAKFQLQMDKIESLGGLGFNMDTPTQNCQTEFKKRKQCEELHEEFFPSAYNEYKFPVSNI